MVVWTAALWCRGKSSSSLFAYIRIRTLCLFVVVVVVVRRYRVQFPPKTPPPLEDINIYICIYTLTKSLIISLLLLLRLLL